MLDRNTPIGPGVMQSSCINRLSTNIIIVIFSPLKIVLDLLALLYIPSCLYNLHETWSFINEITYKANFHIHEPDGFRYCFLLFYI